MNKLFSLLIVSIFVMALSACGSGKSVDNSADVMANITSLSQLSDFKNKPSIILFGGTYCPHCVNEVPNFKQNIYDNYKDRINLWVNVIDGKNGKKFNVEDIPQGFNENLKYNDITGDQCGYVPSWLLMDQDSNVILKSCGSEHTVDELVEKLKSLLRKP